MGPVLRWPSYGSERVKRTDPRTCLQRCSFTEFWYDLAYEEVFAMPIDHFGDADDVLITISSSGNSANIIRAIEAARKVGGADYYLV